MASNILIDEFNTVVSCLSQALESSKSLKKSQEELFDFLDQHYVFYLNSTIEERIKIREIIKTHHESKATPNLIDFFLLGYVQRAIEKLEETGDKTWIIRGLVTSAIEDGIRDHRDTIDLLIRLFRVAKEKDLEPEVAFNNIAKYANSEPSLPGSTPMSQIFLEIPNKQNLEQDSF